jgi:hypothetical protein
MIRKRVKNLESDIEEEVQEPYLRSKKRNSREREQERAWSLTLSRKAGKRRRRGTGTLLLKPVCYSQACGDFASHRVDFLADVALSRGRRPSGL